MIKSYEQRQGTMASSPESSFWAKAARCKIYFKKNCVIIPRQTKKLLGFVLSQKLPCTFLATDIGTHILNLATGYFITYCGYTCMYDIYPNDADSSYLTCTSPY